MVWEPFFLLKVNELREQFWNFIFKVEKLHCVALIQREEKSFHPIVFILSQSIQDPLVWHYKDRKTGPICIHKTKKQLYHTIKGRHDKRMWLLPSVAARRGRGSFSRKHRGKLTSCHGHEGPPEERPSCSSSNRPSRFGAAPAALVWQIANPKK